MTTYALPIVATLIVWWASTGAILYLDGLPRATFRWSLSAATALGLAALWGLAASADQTSLGSAYLAVLCALTLWGWNEMAFLFGFVTGPRRQASLPEARGLTRFVDASLAILHHELALLGTLLVIAAITWNAANPFGWMTFAILFAMRLSTKLNIFLGVPNTTVEFLPAHLAYLKSYFRQRPMNLLFPLSVTVATLFCAFLVHKVALAPDAFSATGFALLAALAALGLIEHWFLVVPLPVAGLWAWGLRSHEATRRGPEPVRTTPLSRNVSDQPATPRAISPSSLVA